MEAEWAEVRALEAEIATLRRACEEPTASWKETPNAKKSFKNIYQSESEGLEFSKDLRRQLGHLESELSLLSTLMGINIRKYSKKTEDLSSTEMTEKDIKKVLQRHRLSGSCHMVTFQLEFQILEIQNEKNLSSVITDLNIIMEPTEYSELSEFVSRAEERRDLFMFFRSLHFFVEWCEYRKLTFKHFKTTLMCKPLVQQGRCCVSRHPRRTTSRKVRVIRLQEEKYPDVVQLPEGAASSCMGIQSASQPGFELVIVWRIQIDDEGKVLPKLDLLTKIPQQALELDKKKVIESAPLSFRTLLGVLGIEAALESLIKLFFNTKE